MPDLPTKLLVADSYAALNPPDVIWRSYLFEIDRLEREGSISEEEYVLLRFTTAAKTALLGFTRGQRNAIEPSIVPEVLDRAKRAVISQAEDELVQRGREATRVEVDERLRDEVERRSTAEQEHAATSRTLAAERERLRQRIRVASQKFGRSAYWGAFLAGVLLVVSASVLVSGYVPEEWRSATIVGVAIGLLTVAGLVNLVAGGTVIGLARWIELRAARFLEARLLGYFVIDA